MPSDVERRALDKALDSLRAASLDATEGVAYTCGQPWFDNGSGVLVGSPDPHAGFFIADTDTSICDPDNHSEIDDDCNAIFIAEAWNFARLVLSRPDLLAALRDPVPAPERGDAGAEAMRALPTIEFHQQDWIPGFAAFLPGATTPEPNSRAFCILNLGALLAAAEAGDIPRAELPYFLSESMMHEVMHVLEQWAGVAFSEERIDALLERYREAALPLTTPQQDRVQGEESGI